MKCQQLKENIKAVVIVAAAISYRTRHVV